MVTRSVDVTLHSFRCRWGAAEADSCYAEQQARMAKMPKIEVPTTLLIGTEAGATLPTSSEGKEAFSGSKYERRLLDGIGHFILRERPGAVSQLAALQTPPKG